MNLQKVLFAGEKSGFKLKNTKCQFLLLEVMYLDDRISKEGIAPLPEKAAAIQKSSTLKNVTELKVFLMNLTYYNHYLANFSMVIDQLHHFLKKEKTYLW